jgi:hypothetical protein
MKSLMSWQVYQFLTSLVHSEYQKPSHLSFSEKLGNFWQKVKVYFQTSSEPCVWRTLDTLGRTQWHGYDPSTNTTIVSESEEDLRVWLEERHYQYHLVK